MLRTTDHGPRTHHAGVTLVELLITILIISILAGALLGVAAVAGETAREAKSRNMVARLHTLLMEHLDTYKSRRIKFRRTVGATNGIKDLIETTIVRGTPAYVRRRGEALQEARLYAVREMMLMEIPDRWSDVYLNQLSASTEGAPYFLAGRTELSNVYLRRYKQLRNRINSLTGVVNTPAEVLANQGAECLYLVIMTATADGEARSLFNESSIGDTDGDGAPEFLDGWGRPIEFLRWAPGFESDVQLNANRLGNPPPMANSETWLAAANSDHDPFDLFRVEQAAYRLVPLVFSAGRDEELGINREDNHVTWRKSTAVTMNPNSPYFQNALTPYKLGSPNYPVNFLGTDDGTKTLTDNIHNHLLGER
jgi:prepilin-type N-terminal cleavage/methylation domain-containing protein